VRSIIHGELADIKLRRKNGWISFSVDGKYCDTSSGDVIDTKTRQVVAQLVESEKLVEVCFENGRPVAGGTR